MFDVDIRDMDEQHQDFLLMHRGKVSALLSAVIAVVNGEGMVNVFADLGVTAIVPGGQTMNPSTTDILRTVEEVPSDNIILLPNNKNVVPAALLVQQLTKKKLRVIPTETVPQGISALVAFIPEADFETNAEQMTAAIATVRTIEITRATRATRLNGLDIKRGQFIGLLDGELLAASDAPGDVIFRLLARIDLAQAHIVTLYSGKDTTQSEAQEVGARIGERYPGLEVGVVKSGQPNYYYIISVE
jgi:dihydroxyacetone kinase-like predicted kinase